MTDEIYAVLGSIFWISVIAYGCGQMKETARQEEMRSRPVVSVPYTPPSKPTYQELMDAVCINNLYECR